MVELSVLVELARSEADIEHFADRSKHMEVVGFVLFSSILELDTLPESEGYKLAVGDVCHVKYDGKVKAT